MKRPAIAAVGLWLAFVIACAVVVGRASFTADLSAFLPRAPSEEQQVLVDQLTEGSLSRLILIAIEGPDAATRALLSRETARRLRASPEFSVVNNGESSISQRDREFLFDHRYLLSPAVTSDRFSVAGLRGAIEASIDLLASPAGLMLKALLPRDPTGELVELLGTQDTGSQPASASGVWASRDGTRALMLAYIRASGSDTDRQQRTLATIRTAFDDAVAANPAASRGFRLLMSGPPVFAVTSRETIRNDAARLAAIGVAGIVGVLVVVYRSVSAVALGLVPVITGALAGIAAVYLGFGVVHGITLGFGTTLIGEAVDYSIYLFVQSTPTARMGQAGEIDRGAWIANFWPTVRLGMLASVVGFATLLFSGFPGLAQLGLYSVSGIVVAALVTRFVLPPLLPRSLRIRDISVLGLALMALMSRARALRWLVAGLLLAAIAVIASARHSIWSSELSTLSPVSAADQALDRTLRSDIGAPDTRYVVVVSGNDEESVLVAAERVGDSLQKLVDAGALAGFETPTRLIPSRASQTRRQKALPPSPVLEARLDAATTGLSIRPERLKPFVADVQAARDAPLVDRMTLDGTTLALATDSMLMQRRGRWTALLPLRASVRGNSVEIDPKAVRAAVSESGEKAAVLVDIKNEADRLYSGYLGEALYLSLAGLAVMLVLLAVALRSAMRVLRVVAPLLAAVIVVAAAHVLSGTLLNILHLVGMLLIVAVGSNYALFFDRRGAGGSAMAPSTLASLALACTTTVFGFGVLALSNVPVLHAIGATVGPGAVLALVFSAVYAARPEGNA